ncbi:hypothetical protein C241_25666, partial [Bradyrhizobium lupini HPC(L)]
PFRHFILDVEIVGTLPHVDLPLRGRCPAGQRGVKPYAPYYRCERTPLRKIPTQLRIRQILALQIDAGVCCIAL